MSASPRPLSLHLRIKKFAECASRRQKKLSASACLPPSRLLDCRHVNLLHLHHRLESTLRFRPASLHGFGQRPRRDLPGQTPAILAPATRAFLSTVVDDRI